MAIRIPVTLVVELTDQQQADYIADFVTPRAAGKVMARDVVAGVRAHVLSIVVDNGLFSSFDVSIKER